MKTLYLRLLVVFLLVSCGGGSGGGADDIENSDPVPAASLPGSYTLTGFETGREVPGNPPGSVYLILTQDDFQPWSGAMLLAEDGFYSATFETSGNINNQQGEWVAQGDQLLFIFDDGTTDQNTYTLDGDQLTITYEDPGYYWTDYWERNP